MGPERILVAICGLLTGLFATYATTAAAQEPARHALLIGNQSYAREVGTLRNPANDVALISAALEKVGFKRENIRRIADADRVTILAEIDAYADRLAAAGPDAIGFFYYSGHGVANERDQRNYLIPVEVKKLDASVWYSGVPLDDIIAKLSARAGEASHFVLFDACRNVLNLPTRGSKGFVPVAERRGMLIGFSTDPGKTASDAGAASGPYAAALAAELVKPGQHHLDLFQNVKEQVFRTTKAQVPWERNGLLSRVYLAGTAAVVPPGQEPRSPLPTRLSEAAEAWGLIRDSGDAVVLEVFVSRFGDTFYGDLAKRRMAGLKEKEQRVPLLQRQENERRRVATAAAEKVPADKRRADERARSRDPVASLAPGSGKSARDCPACPEMIVVPAGSFMMGSSEAEIAVLTAAVPFGTDWWDKEGPRRRVTIGKPLAIGKFEVTFDEWDACVKAGGCTHKPEDRGWGRGRQPVIIVSWDDAERYVAWLSKMTGKDYRLLSEAEWEYAARAGTTTRYSWGDNFDAAKANNGRISTVLVGKYAANAFGLHDMHGNVHEWVADCWNGNYKGAPTDGSARTSAECGRRVVRGGSWVDAPESLRSAFRFANTTNVRLFNLGFRVGRTLSPLSPYRSTSWVHPAPRRLAKVGTQDNSRSGPSELGNGRLSGSSDLLLDAMLRGRMLGEGAARWRFDSVPVFAGTTGESGAGGGIFWFEAS